MVICHGSPGKVTQEWYDKVRTCFVHIRKGFYALKRDYSIDNQHGEKVPGLDFSLHLAPQKVPLWSEQSAPLYITILSMKERTRFWVYRKNSKRKKTSSEIRQVAWRPHSKNSDYSFLFRVLLRNGSCEFSLWPHNNPVWGTLAPLLLNSVRCSQINFQIFSSLLVSCHCWVD